MILLGEKWLQEEIFIEHLQDPAHLFTVWQESRKGGGRRQLAEAKAQQ